MQDFARNLKYLRKINNLNQEDVAKIVNKDRSLISQWEADTKTATVEDIIKLSNHFNISMDKLVDSDLSLEENNENFNELDEFGILLSSKMKDLPEDKQRLIMNVTKSIIEEVDKELDRE